MSGSELLRVEHLAASWGKTPVFADVSFAVRPSELVVLMGPNGSGKTTLLRCLVGLEPAVRGSIWLDGRLLDGVPTHRRGLGLLSQDPAMFPNRTVAENVAYGLDVARIPRSESEPRVLELLDRLEIRSLAHRNADRLSGGERQRVALARTLALRPKLVLLDEPFASVDPEFRESLRADFRGVLREEHVAAIHVTHDRDEGLFLADRVMLLLDGALRQEGSPDEVFARPASIAVATFLGYNVLSRPLGTEAVLPEHLRVVEVNRGKIRARVLATGTLGVQTELHLRDPYGGRIVVRTSREIPGPPTGAEVGLDWEAGVPMLEGSPERPSSPP